MLRNNVTNKWKGRNIMKEKLISKKQLLDKYGISYGALYRWKRKGLIPDEWFIKKSTVTGQETFFPEKLVCKRVEKIMSMKDEVLLDELARKLSGEDSQQEIAVINTEYGEKRIKLADIKSVTAVDKNGNEKDVSESFFKLFTTKTNIINNMFGKRNNDKGE